MKMQECIPNKTMTCVSVLASRSPNVGTQRTRGRAAKRQDRSGWRPHGRTRPTGKRTVTQTQGLFQRHTPFKCNKCSLVKNLEIPYLIWPIQFGPIWHLKHSTSSVMRLLYNVMKDFQEDIHISIKKYRPELFQRLCYIRFIVCFNMYFIYSFFTCIQ